MFLLQNYQPTILRDNAKPVMEDEETGSRFKNRLDTFAGRTTLGMVVFMKEGQHIGYKLFWFFIFLAGLGGCTYNISLLIGNYFSYNIDTTVSLGYEKLPFPSVTVCNINPTRSSAISAGSPTGNMKAMQQFAAQLQPKQVYNKPPPGQAGSAPTAGPPGPPGTAAPGPAGPTGNGTANNTQSQGPATQGSDVTQNFGSTQRPGTQGPNGTQGPGTQNPSAQSSETHTPDITLGLEMTQDSATQSLGAQDVDNIQGPTIQGPQGPYQDNYETVLDEDQPHNRRVCSVTNAAR